ncbi:hypothetical protein LR69_04543 [Geobacillus sp. BCO2]|nr:hypothetical protein LR69_04543 [Geobacillus sp. BCO2]
MRPSSMPFLSNATRLVEQFIERLIENNFGMFFWNVLATVDEPIHQHKMTTKTKRRHEPDSLGKYRCAQNPFAQGRSCLINR